MSTKYKGKVIFGSVLKPDGATPIDERFVVERRSDLTTFDQSVVYEGMVVSVLEDKSLYVLSDKNYFYTLTGWIEFAHKSDVNSVNASTQDLSTRVKNIEYFFDSKGTQNVIDTFKDVSDFLATISDQSTLIGIMEAEHNTLKDYVDASVQILNDELSASIHNLDVSLTKAHNANTTLINNVNTSLTNKINSDISTLSNKFTNDLSAFKAETGANVSNNIGKLKEVIGLDASFKNAHLGSKNVVQYIDDASLFKTSLDNTIKTDVELGDIAKGTKVSTLKTMTTSQILEKILFKDYLPTTTTPTLTISTTGLDTSYISGVYYIEVGDKFDESKFSISNTEGYVKCENGTVKWTNKSGNSQTKYTDNWKTPVIKINNTATTTWPYQLTTADTTYNVNCTRKYEFYEAAFEKMSSHGNDATAVNPIPSCEVTSNTLKFVSVKPYFTNGNWSSESVTDLNYPTDFTFKNVKKLPSGADAYVYACFYAQNTSSNSGFKVYLPKTKTISSAKALNEFTGQYDVNYTSSFTKNGTYVVNTKEATNDEYDVYQFYNGTTGKLKIKFHIKNK